MKIEVVGGKILVFSGSRKLVKIDDSLNSAKYILFLKKQFKRDLDEGEIFQHYGTTYRRSQVTQQKLIDECVIVLKYSLDYSPALKYGSNVDRTKE